jgi:hypothetical protein
MPGLRLLMLTCAFLCLSVSSHLWQSAVQFYRIFHPFAGVELNCNSLLVHSVPLVVLRHVALLVILVLVPVFHDPAQPGKILLCAGDWHCDLRCNTAIGGTTPTHTTQRESNVLVTCIWQELSASVKNRQGREKPKPETPQKSSKVTKKNRHGHGKVTKKAWPEKIWCLVQIDYSGCNSCPMLQLPVSVVLCM